MEHVVQREYVIGIDEVGRGPIAGPVVVCACAVLVGINVLPLFPKQMLRDSKKLSEKRRLDIVKELQHYRESSSVIVGVGEIEASQIDAIGIVPSIKEAMMIALNAVHSQGVSKNSFVVLDGSLSLPASYQQETIIKGDETVPEIALASIIAKVHRDTHMKQVGDIYPSYGFTTNVGYGTQAHYEAIKAHGLTPLHRRSFLKNL